MLKLMDPEVWARVCPSNLGDEEVDGRLLTHTVMKPGRLA